MSALVVKPGDDEGRLWLVLDAGAAMVGQFSERWLAELVADAANKSGETLGDLPDADLVEF